MFAIGNYFQQRLLYPAHCWGMCVLRTIPCDGTYHLTRPIERLVHYNEQNLFSYDLKSATDRWPVIVIHAMMHCFFGSSLSLSVVLGAGLSVSMVSLFVLRHFHMTRSL